MSAAATDPAAGERAAAARGPVEAARAGPYLCLRSRDASGDEHVDLFELRAGPVHRESFSGNQGLPESALRARLTVLLGSAPALAWTAIPPGGGGA